MARKIEIGDTLLSGDVLKFSFPSTPMFAYTSSFSEDPVFCITTSSGKNIVVAFYIHLSASGSYYVTETAIGITSETSGITAETLDINFYYSIAKRSVDMGEPDPDNPDTVNKNWDFYVLDEDFGTVLSIDTNKGVYDKIKFGKTPWENIFKGANKIDGIYFNNYEIIKVMLGEEECYVRTFAIDGKKYFKEKNQTWAQWIDQGKYYSAEDNFTYTSNVYLNDIIINNYESSSYVHAQDLIVDNYDYHQGNACLDKNTLIRTTEGNRTIDSFKIGDIISTNNKVEKIVKHNKNYYYEIILNNNDIIKASNDHKFILISTEIKHTEQLKINDYFTNDLYIKEIRKINQSLDMYEIKTSTNKYELYNGIVCECEDI